MASTLGFPRSYFLVGFSPKLSFILQMTKVQVVRERNYPKRIDTVFKICQDYVMIEVIYYNEKFDLVSALNLRILAQSKLLRVRLDKKTCHSIWQMFPVNIKPQTLASWAGFMLENVIRKYHDKLPLCAEFYICALCCVHLLALAFSE